MPWFLGISQGLNILQKPKLRKAIWISGRTYIRDYSNPTLILDSFAWILCLHPITLFFLPVRLHFSRHLVLVCIKLQISLFSLSPQSEPNVSLCLHPFRFLYIFLSFTVPAASDFRYFGPFLSCASPPFVCLFLLNLFLVLSISICLSGQFGFSQGYTLTRWNGVSLFLRWWRHFAVRITASDIDGKETQDLRGHHKQAGRKGRAPNQHTHQLLQVEENTEDGG